MRGAHRRLWGEAKYPIIPRRMSLPKRILGLAMAAASLAGAPAALAQTTPTEIARRELLDQAEAARLTGDHARALELASRAAQLRVTPSLRLLIAQEHTAVGHVLEALDQSSVCAREAAADAAMNNRERILEACRALAASLAQQVGRVVVRVPAAPEGTVVRVAGTEVSAALWGVAFPVVPGEVTVTAEAPGATAFQRVVTVAAGASEDVEVALVVTARRPPVVIAPPPVVAPAQPARGPGAGPWIVLGVGAASLGASLAFALLRNDALSTRDAECDIAGRGPCRDRPLAEAANSDYRTFTAVTDATLAVGAAGVVAGGLWLLLGRSAAPARATALHVVPRGDGALIGLSGAL